LKLDSYFFQQQFILQFEACFIIIIICACRDYASRTVLSAIIHLKKTNNKNNIITAAIIRIKERKLNDIIYLEMNDVFFIDLKLAC